MGMDRLSKRKFAKVCREKVVRIPLEGDEILQVHGERTQGVLKTLMNAKFHIDLVPEATSVAKSRYRLAPLEMQELSEQLQELQDKDNSKKWNSSDDQLRLRWRIYLVVLADAAESVSDVIEFEYYLASSSGWTKFVLVFVEAAKHQRDHLMAFMDLIGSKRDRLITLHVSLYDSTLSLIPLSRGSFDVIVGMDWLSKRKFVIVCHEKVVRIPLEGNEILQVHGERTQGVVKTLNEHKDLVHGATSVAKSPYRLAPLEMQELSEQLRELQDKVLEVLRKEKLYAKSSVKDKILATLSETSQVENPPAEMLCKTNVVIDALRRKEGVKSRRVRAMAMTTRYKVRGMMLPAQSEAFKQENGMMRTVVMDETHASRKCQKRQKEAKSVKNRQETEKTRKRVKTGSQINQSRISPIQVNEDLNESPRTNDDKFAKLKESFGYS
ncbi:hypothetical protein Tco_0661710 [Tanacetum coccineum]